MSFGLTAGRPLLFLAARAIPANGVFVGDNIGVRVSVRTGDMAILFGAAAIAVYEYRCDQDNLISMRVSAYRKHPVGRVITDSIILATALHLTEAVKPEHDVYHWIMGWFRPNRPTSP